MFLNRRAAKSHTDGAHWDYTCHTWVLKDREHKLRKDRFKVQTVIKYIL